MVKRNTWSNYTGGKKPPTIYSTSKNTKQNFVRVDNSKAIRIGTIRNTMAYMLGLEWLKEGQDWLHEKIRYK